jgi:hypothetical protein
MVSSMTSVHVDDPNRVQNASMTITGLLDLAPNADGAAMAGTIRLCSVVGSLGDHTIAAPPEAIATASPAPLALQPDQEGFVLADPGFALRVSGIRHTAIVPTPLGNASVGLVLAAQLDVTGWWPTVTDDGGLSGTMAFRDTIEVIESGGIPVALAQSFLKGQREKWRVRDRRSKLTTTPVAADGGCP